MFMDHDTFIIGYSIAKHHMSFTPELINCRLSTQRLGNKSKLIFGHINFKAVHNLYEQLNIIVFEDDF